MFSYIGRSLAAKARCVDDHLTGNGSAVIGALIKDSKMVDEQVAAAKFAANAAQITKGMLRGLAWGAGAKTSETKENVTATKLAKIWAEAVAKCGGVDEALAEGTKERNARKTSWHRYSDSTPLVAFPRPSSVVWPLLRCRWPTPQIGQLASVGDAQVQR